MSYVVGLVDKAEYERIKEAEYLFAHDNEVEHLLIRKGMLYFARDAGLFPVAVWVPCDVEDLLDIPGKEKAGD